MVSMSDDHASGGGDAMKCVNDMQLHAAMT